MNLPDHFPQPLATWAIVELMGRTVMAGFLREVEVAGVGMLRIDVPAVDDIPAFHKFFSTKSIYGIEPTDEETAKRKARSFMAYPEAHIKVYQRALPEAGEPIDAEFDAEPGEDDVPF